MRVSLLICAVLALLFVVVASQPDDCYTSCNTAVDGATFEECVAECQKLEALEGAIGVIVEEALEGKISEEEVLEGAIGVITEKEDNSAEGYIGVKVAEDYSLEASIGEVSEKSFTDKSASQCQCGCDCNARQGCTLIGMNCCDGCGGQAKKVSPISEKQYQEYFSSFIKKYQKKYTHDEFFPRYTIFKANYNKIREHNLNSKATFTMAVNEFADMTFTEFHSKMTGYKRVDNSYLRSKNGPHKTVKKMASSLDWRQHNAVTAVKNQQQCGSCWSFSSTGSIEGAHAIKTGNLVSLSEQQLVDCSTAQGNQGCNGGLMDQAFQYVISAGGLTTEAAYPYTAAQGTCQFPGANMTVAATISKFTDVTAGDENALMAAVNIGPVSIAIEADQECFQFYSGGVLSDPSCGTQLDHGVLVVGYGTDSSTGSDVPYWIVKNSWGASWGEQGYVRLIRGKNECGIASEPSYPSV